MDSLAALRAQAQELGRGRFLARFSHGFLIKRPSPAGDSRDDADDDDFDDDAATRRMGFSTRIVRAADLALDLVGQEVLDAQGWVVVALAKRAGNPFPERINVGRARNCDVALRTPTVSKLHAHFHVEGDRVVRLTDCGSANGTYVNDRRVESSAGLPVAFGGRVRFGALELELAPPEATYALVLTATR